MRLAVVGALVSGAVLLPAAPASAAVNVSPRAFELKPGESREITITVTGGDAENPQATITVPNELSGEVSLTGCGENGRTVLDCSGDDFSGGDNAKQLQIRAAAKNPSGLQPNQNRQGNITVGSGNQDQNISVRVQGPEQAASVTEVTGKVVNQSTGDPVPNAQVTLKDSANNEHNATANARGDFRITPQNRPIVAGQLTLTATFEGFTEGTANANGVAGRATNGVQIRMKPAAASVPPSAPAAVDPPSAEASADPTDLAQPSNTSGESDGPSLLSWLLIGMGVVLVLLGVGAIALLVMRRKDDRDDQADEYGEPGPNQMAPVGAAAGGAYRGADRTMVAGAPGINDATAIVGPQQPLDEFPDPYAAPAPTRVGYGSGYGGSGYGGGGYGDEPPGYGRGEPGYSNGGGYRDEHGYESPRGGGYGDDPRGGAGGYGGGGAGGYGSGGGYGDSPRGRYADEPTGHYQVGGGGGYASGGYGGDVNGRGPGGPANGYGPGSGHGAPANGYGPGGGYDDGPRGGGGSYPSAGGYERPPSDYADPRNGRGRNVEWLD